jgi:NitT/TauT family transport system permease protein
MERRETFGFIRDLATRWDAAAIIVILGLIAFAGEASRGLFEPLARLDATPISLDPWFLPQYAARTTLRMFAALALSLLFTLTYATWAAKSERAGKLLVPILDILQSVPILGFISITYVFFMSLAPGRVIGAEFAVIFAIFTSQAWNMAFSFYQSMRTVPYELREAADSYHLSPWMRFWQLELPFGMPPLIWNMMMSMSGGWFFVVLAESFTVGPKTVTLPGVGSYVALAIEQGNLHAIGWAILTMGVVILIYDQLLFRPLIAWVDRFQVQQEADADAPESWALKMMQRSKIIAALSSLFYAAVRWTSRVRPPGRLDEMPRKARSRRFDKYWYVLVILIVCVAAWHIGRVLVAHTSFHEAMAVCLLALITLLRVVVLIALASLIWVPIGVWVGLRPRATQIVQPIAQFLAAFPNNLFFPLAVAGIVEWKLNPDIWLSPLMILGTQWYILFNVIAGAAAMPGELRYAAQNFGLRGWLWWRKVALPGVLPFYVTGAITASGGSWNAAIAAEIVNWKGTTVKAHGLGTYIFEASEAGDYHRIVLGIMTMCLFVIAVNRCFWRPLYYYAERKFRLT